MARVGDGAPASAGVSPAHGGDRWSGAGHVGLFPPETIVAAARAAKQRRPALSAQPAARHDRRADDGEPELRPLPRLAAGRRRAAGRAPVHRQAGQSARDPPARRHLPGLRLHGSRPFVGRRAHRLDGGQHGRLPKADSDVFSIGYYGESDLGFTPHVAQKYTAYDRFFCSLLASTYPNREYMHAAQSYGDEGQRAAVRPQGLGFPDTTIFTALDAGGRLEPVLLLRPAGVVILGHAGDRALRPGPGVLRALRERDAARGLLRGPVVPGRGPGDLRRRASARRRACRPGVHLRRRPRRSWSRRSTSAARCSSSTTNGAGSSTTSPAAGAGPALEPQPQPGLRPDGVPHPGHGHLAVRAPWSCRPLDLRVESILKLIRYRFGLPPLTHARPATPTTSCSLDFDSARTTKSPSLPDPPSVVASACTTEPSPAGTGGTGGGGVGGSARRARPGSSTWRRRRGRRSTTWRQLKTSGYLERLGFDYKPATPERTFRHPSKLGLKP